MNRSAELTGHRRDRAIAFIGTCRRAAGDYEGTVREVVRHDRRRDDVPLISCRPSDDIALRQDAIDDRRQFRGDVDWRDAGERGHAARLR